MVAVSKHPAAHVLDNLGDQAEPAQGALREAA